MRTLTLPLLFTAASLVGQDLPGLVGHWPMNDHALDLSPNALHGTPDVGAWQGTADREQHEGCAVRVLEGGFVTAESALFASGTPYGITLAMWVRRSQANGFASIRMFPSGPGVQLGVRADGIPSLGTWVDEIAAAPGQVPVDDAWHHVAGTYQVGAWNLYFDGQLVASTVNTLYEPMPGPAAMIVGGVWDVELDDLQVFDRALPLTEIAILAEQPTTCELVAAVQEVPDNGFVLLTDPTTGVCSVVLHHDPGPGTTVRLADMAGRTMRRLAIRGRRTGLELHGLPVAPYVITVVGPGYATTRTILSGW
ncbi:MAG: LamG domain-containing protein [Flavobacteriales bacterium]|nr:LamG domain-containing protein [Flavobacteriales bacterium]